VATPTKQRLDVDGVTMAFRDEGEGDPIVFLHGNPTSSHLWRNVIPHVADLGRCIAPDLVGMGDSAKLPDPGPDRYTLAEHQRYLDELLDRLGVADAGDATFVVHDWGSALGFDWCRRHPDAVAGICFMEAIVQPLTWDDWPGVARSIFQGLRSDAGEEMILEKNLFLERILPAGDPPHLTPEDMDEYRRPYLGGGEDRRPMLTWPRQIPIDGEPDDVVATVERYAAWLASEASPRKLFVDAAPGSILVGRQREAVRSWPKLTEITVAGTHFVQEFSPHEIGAALREWMLADR
jgi:haloalkane dehalogenase